MVLLATAAGVAIAHQRRFDRFIGDISALHDLQLFCLIQKGQIANHYFYY